MMFLQTYVITTSQCVRLVKKYGSGAKRILQDEPYRLAEDIERIGFKTADKIALNLGFPPILKSALMQVLCTPCANLKTKATP